MSAKKVESMIHADGVDISVVTTVGSEDDYISLTDMARRKNPVAPKDVVKNWLRIRSTIEYLGLWEELNNPNFKGVEFDSFKTGLVKTLLHCLRNNGSRPPTQSDLFPSLAAMVVGLLPIKTSPLSSLHGCPRSLSYTSSRTTSVSRRMRVIGLPLTGT